MKTLAFRASIFVLTAFILAIYLPEHNAFAGEKILIHRVAGDAFVSYVDEELTVDDLGIIELKTISPFPRSFNHNRIGEFRRQLSAEEFGALKVKLENFESILDKAKFKPRMLKKLDSDQLVEEMWIGRRVLTGIEHFHSLRSLTTDLREQFLTLKNLALDNPVAALALVCEPPAEKSTSINCHYENVGTKNVKTIDPSSMEGALRCLNLNQREIVVNPGKTGDPRLMRPKIVELKPKEKLQFSMKKHQECELTVSVKTTDMLINPKYKNVLLGHLNSNLLSPSDKKEGP